MASVTICSSASFYEQVVDMANNLEQLGVSIILPHIASVMKQSGDYD